MLDFDLFGIADGKVSYNTKYALFLIHKMHICQGSRIIFVYSFDCMSASENLFLKWTYLSAPFSHLQRVAMALCKFQNGT